MAAKTFKLYAYETKGGRLHKYIMGTFSKLDDAIKMAKMLPKRIHRYEIKEG
jgi:hypothetical protein